MKTVFGRASAVGDFMAGAIERCMDDDPVGIALGFGVMFALVGALCFGATKLDQWGVIKLETPSEPSKASCAVSENINPQKLQPGQAVLLSKTGGCVFVLK